MLRFITRFLAFALIATLAAGCTGNDSTSTPGVTPPGITGTPTATATATATPPSSASPAPSRTPTPALTPNAVLPWHPAGTRAGVPMVDRVITLLETRDAAALTNLLQWQQVPCGTGIGDAECPPGTSPGQVVEAFPIVRCEGAMVPRGTFPGIREELRQALAGAFHLHLVYEAAERGPSGGSPYGIVFTKDDLGVWAQQVVVDDTGVLEIDQGCAETPLTYWRRPGERSVLDPPPFDEARVLAYLETRPLRLDSMPGKNTCAVSPARETPAGAAQGSSVYLMGEGAVRYSLSPADPGWRIASAGILRAPGIDGPVLVRGMRIDRPGALRFGMIPEDRLVLPSRRSDRWDVIDPTYLRVPAAGCYALQVDSLDGGGTIVFEATPAPAGLPDVGQAIDVAVAPAAPDGPETPSCIELIEWMVSERDTGTIPAKTVACKVTDEIRHRFRFTRDTAGVLHLLDVNILVHLSGDFPQNRMYGCEEVGHLLLPATSSPDQARFHGTCQTLPPPPGEATTSREIWAEVPEGTAPLPDGRPCWLLASYLGPDGEAPTRPQQCVLYGDP